MDSTEIKYMLRHVFDYDMGKLVFPVFLSPPK